ncbi:hypothetical protein [Paenibacillus taichungensis]
MVGVTFDYNIQLPERVYAVGETIEHDGKKYAVRALGKSFLVFLVPIQ